LQAEQDGLVKRTFRRLDPDRQEALIEAILAEAAEVGPDQIRIQEIARRAGAAVGSMYQYFPNRGKLLEFALRLCNQAWVDLFSQYIPMLAAMPLKEGLKAYLLGGLEMSETERGVVQFFGRAAYQGAQGVLKTAIEPIAIQMLDGTREMLRQAQIRGEVRADIDLEASARALNACLIALGDGQIFPYLNEYYRLTGENMPYERVLDAAIEMILSGIGSTAARS
jgi:AcrR family transcriptional regulator